RRPRTLPLSPRAGGANRLADPRACKQVWQDAHLSGAAPLGSGSLLTPLALGGSMLNKRLLVCCPLTLASVGCGFSNSPSGSPGTAGTTTGSGSPGTGGTNPNPTGSGSGASGGSSAGTNGSTGAGGSSSTGQGGSAAGTTGTGGSTGAGGSTG